MQQPTYKYDSLEDRPRNIIKPILAAGTAAALITAAVWMWPTDDSTSISTEITDQAAVTGEATGLFQPDRPDQPQAQSWQQSTTTSALTTTSAPTTTTEATTTTAAPTTAAPTTAAPTTAAPTTAAPTTAAPSTAPPTTEARPTTTAVQTTAAPTTEAKAAARSLQAAVRQTTTTRSEEPSNSKETTSTTAKAAALKIQVPSSTTPQATPASPKKQPTTTAKATETTKAPTTEQASTTQRPTTTTRPSTTQETTPTTSKFKETRPVPRPPTTEAPATTAKPTTTQNPTTARPTTTTEATTTTAKPTTTQAPATTQAPTTAQPTTTTQATTTTEATTTTAKPTTTTEATTTTAKPTTTTEATTTTAEPTTTTEATTTTAEPTTTTEAPTTTQPRSGSACFNRIYRTDFNGSSVDSSWFLYNGSGHDGNGLRRPEAISVRDGKLIITAQNNSNGTLVSGGMSHNIKQKYGMYSFRARVDSDPGKATSGVILTWPESGNNSRDGENNMFETSWTSESRSPFYSYIHYPYQDTSKPTQQFQAVHSADASQWQTITMEWTPSMIKITRQDDNGTKETLLKETDSNHIPDVKHLMTIQLDTWKNSSPSNKPVRLEVDWVEIYAYCG